MDRTLAHASFLTLEYVVCLAREGNFSRAAQSLFITQSALSQHVLGLEKKLRVQLFDRSRSPLALTREGRAFVEGARAILQSRDALWRTMADFADFRRGEMVLGTTPVRSLFLLPTVLPLFAGRYPAIRLTAMEAAGPELESMLVDDGLDLAVFPFIREHPELAYETLYTEEIRLYAPAGFVLPPAADLASVLGSTRQTLILMHAQTQFGSHVNRLLRSVRVMPRIIEVGNYLIALSLVSSGLGLAFAPDNLFGSENYRREAEPLPLRLEGGDRRIVVAYRRKKRLTRAALDLIELIRQLAGKPRGPGTASSLSAGF